MSFETDYLKYLNDVSASLTASLTRELAQEGQRIKAQMQAQGLGSSSEQTRAFRILGEDTIRKNVKCLADDSRRFIENQIFISRSSTDKFFEKAITDRATAFQVHIARLLQENKIPKATQVAPINFNEIEDLRHGIKVEASLLSNLTKQKSLFQSAGKRLFDALLDRVVIGIVVGIVLNHLFAR